jgi:hypothetical protein
MHHHTGRFPIDLIDKNPSGSYFYFSFDILFATQSSGRQIMGSKIAIFIAAMLITPNIAFSQQIVEQKKAVAFAFGNVHVPNPEATGGVGAQLPKSLLVNQPLGTVFFVGYPDARGGPAFTFGYLVTAKHVLKDSDKTYLKEIRIRLNLKNTSADHSTETITLPVSIDGKTLIWLHDDDDDAIDIAAIPFLPDLEKFDFKAIPIDWFADDATIRDFKVAEGDSLYFIGLMAQYYGKAKNYPVVRRGTLAMMTDEKIETPTGLQKAYIAELVSWPGNSGSPVFLNLGGMRDGALSLGMNLKFLGILSGSFLNAWKGTILDSQLIEGNALNTGISFIVPAGEVRAILDSPAAQSLRDTAIRNQPAKSDPPSEK